jgi:hypothetical protein
MYGTTMEKINFKILERGGRFFKIEKGHFEGGITRSDYLTICLTQGELCCQEPFIRELYLM